MLTYKAQDFEEVFYAFSAQVPLEIFSFGGSLLEELVSPIPTYLVMGIVGSLAFAQDLGPLHLIFLMFIGAFGKSLGAAFYYFVGDTLEDLFRGTIAKFFRISPGTIENFGKKFSGQHWKDGGLIFLLRVFPLTPTTPFSLACGVLKIDFRVYFLATLFGNFCKDIVYVLLGYYGVASLNLLWKDIQWYKVEFEWILGFILLGVLITFFFQSDFWKAQKNKFSHWQKK